MRKTLLLALVLAAVALSPLAAQCESDDDCDDGVPCTVDTCGDGGECAYAPACDDGLDCTVDICEADGSCENRPIRAMCQPVSCISGSCEPLTCVTGVCSATAPVPGPGQRVLPGGVSGCFRIMDDAFCADTWDGCACNGIETCSGTGANTAGCSAAPRTSWPCEGAPAGDGNACTEENCCEPWNPAGCRLHRALQAAVEPDEVPQLRQFCDAVEDSALSVTTPNGSTVQCTTGDARFRIPAVDPVIGAPVPVDKPPGYWCDNCNPCDIDSCNPATGACNRSQPLPDGTQIPQPAPSPLDPLLAMLPPFCTTNQFCEGERNFGCAERACFGGICANGPNPDNPDPSRSEQCHGFPVTEFEGEQIPPHRATSGGRGCFELQCRDVPLASVVAPNFDCVAVPHNELCADGLFCNGPPLCDPREICGGCNETQLARTLLRSATYLASAPPPADRLIAGCARLSPSEVCDDGIDCTADSCLEGADGDGTGSCQNIADERRCAAAAGGDWSACDPGFTCLVEEGCEPVDNPCVSEHGCELECLDYDGFRQCRADPDSCGTEECFDEGFVTVELSDLTNLCPFHPDGTVPQGDRDFDGHGPLIAIDVSLSHRGGDVLATVRFTAQETRRDFSTIDVSWTRVVATTPFDILGIVSETTGRALGASSPGGTAGIACGDCGVVSFYRFEGVITDAKVRGDTPDGDISDDANCSEDTLLQWLELSTVELAVRKDGCGLI